MLNGTLQETEMETKIVVCVIFFLTMLAITSYYEIDTQMLISIGDEPVFGIFRAIKRFLEKQVQDGHGQKQP